MSDEQWDIDDYIGFCRDMPQEAGQKMMDEVAENERLRAELAETRLRQGAMMRTKIVKWGGSKAIRIPKWMADGLGIVDGTPAKFEVKDGKLYITPLPKEG